MGLPGAGVGGEDLTAKITKGAKKRLVIPTEGRNLS
jgi:hypothetical protein